jgi:heme exporter protein C
VHLGLSLAAVAAMALAMWASLIYAKDATNLAGDEMLAQRIFYIHMGCNIGAFAGFIVSVVGSIGYLITRNLDWDRLAHAAVEVGTVIGLGTILTGVFWAKPTWNTWWTWDPRLTTSTITVLVYVAYLMLRNGIENRQARARFASIYAVFAFLSVPLTYFSARLFRSIHPVVFGNGSEDAQGGFAVGSTMVTTLEITISAFVILFSALLILRWRQLRIEDELAELQDEASN